VTGPDGRPIVQRKARPEVVVGLIVGFLVLAGIGAAIGPTTTTTSPATVPAPAPLAAASSTSYAGTSSSAETVSPSKATQVGTVSKQAKCFWEVLQ
jgi:hypothetical protein